jgi:hypothetical protein
MTDTTLRVSEKTYDCIVRTRGAFEQTFGKKLSLDDAMYLAGSYVNIAYDVYKDLEREGLMNIVPTKDGSFNIRWTRIDNILEKGIPRLLTAFQNLKKLLEEKRATVTISSGQVS